MNIIFIGLGLFFLVMILLHGWYDYRENHVFPFTSGKFWKTESKIILISAVLTVPLALYIDKSSNNQWVWESHDFYNSDWGDSPTDVRDREDFTGRPSGTVDSPPMVDGPHNLSYLYVKPEHLYPLTRRRGKQPRAYFFKNGFLAAGCDYIFYSDPNDKRLELIRQYISKNNLKYGDPVFSIKNEMFKAII